MIPEPTPSDFDNIEQVLDFLRFCVTKGGATITSPKSTFESMLSQVESITLAFYDAESEIADLSHNIEYLSGLLDEAGINY